MTQSWISVVEAFTPAALSATMTSETNLTLILHHESVCSLVKYPYGVLIAGSKIVGFLTQEQVPLLNP